MAKQRLRKTNPSSPFNDARLALVAMLKNLAATYRAWLPKVLLIAGLTLWIYGPALNGGWIWDDTWYVAANPLMHGLTGLWKFWFRPGSWVEYYPIQETVQWLEYQFFGENTLGYHLVNVGLHILSSLLVWHLFTKLGLRLAWLGGLLFAIHPAHVESVALVSELKNTLSLPFFLMAMCFWIDYEEKKRKEDYQGALILFLAAMLCKITMAPFPLIVLLYAWWKRGRIEWKDLKASLPFFGISLVLGIVNIAAGQAYLESMHTQSEGLPAGGLLSRFAGAGLIGSVYFAHMFLPAGLLLAYPRWPVNPYGLFVYIPWLALAIVLCWLWGKRRGWGRHVLLGLLFFLVTLTPFLGLNTISYMSFTWVLDHLLYIPSIGLTGLAVAALGDIGARLSPRLRPCGAGGVALLVVMMAVASHATANLFRSDEALWTYVLLHNPDNMRAHHNLGSDLLKKGDIPGAIAQFEEAVALEPGLSDGYFGLGMVLRQMGRTEEARAQFEHGLRLNPNHADIDDVLGGMAQRQGDDALAEKYYRQALQVDPGDGAAGVNLGDILFHGGHIPEAIDVYRQALELNPGLPQLRYNLGNALLQAGRFPEAAEQLKVAVTLNPHLAAAHENLGTALAGMGRIPEAIRQFEAAAAINPQVEQVHSNLARAYVQAGRITEGIEQFQQALRINPNDAAARENLARLKQFEMRKNAPGSN